MPSSSCLCKIHNKMFNVSDIISTKMCSSAKKVCEYRHLARRNQCNVPGVSNFMSPLSGRLSGFPSLC